MVITLISLWCINSLWIYYTRSARAIYIHDISSLVLTYVIISVLCSYFFKYSYNTINITLRSAFTTLVLGLSWATTAFATSQWWTTKDPAENLLATSCVFLMIYIHLKNIDVTYKHVLLQQLTLPNILLLKYNTLRPRSLIHTATTWQASFTATILYSLFLTPRKLYCNPAIYGMYCTYLSRTSALLAFTSLLNFSWILVLCTDIYNYIIIVSQNLIYILLYFIVKTPPISCILYFHVCLIPNIHIILILSILLFNNRLQLLHRLPLIYLCYNICTPPNIWLLHNITEILLLIIIISSIWLLLIRRYLGVRRLRADPLLPA
jgi:hypothetical protein